MSTRASKLPKELREIVDRNRFKLVRKIAEGGMGAVYEAIQVGTEGFEKVVAIKMIHDSLSADKEFVDMFIGEAKLVADLVHQNIVQIYQLGKVESFYYIAMEYIDGVNLQEFLNRHMELGLKMPVDIAAFVISRVCRALEYAHKKADRNGNLLGVVHRDVSPKNVMINTEGVTKLTDFGIAKAAGLLADQEGDVLMGKAQYMSPEQAQYLHTDRRSDIFSLGIVFYEVLSGQNLFGSDKTSVILDNVVYKEIPKPKQINPDVPEEVERILLKALERNVDKRYQDAGKMGYDLEYYMYHNRFGPTNVTLEKYMNRLFPELFRPGQTRDEKVADFERLRPTQGADEKHA
ncbi:MAG: serine/threonine protein kinase [Planctomycetes bacterium]|nr:serine/threonine protein kinase [Planctomycetota bacterium]